MTCRLTLYLDEFGSEALRRSSRAHGRSPSALVAVAARVYLAATGEDRLARRPPPRPPGLSGDGEPVRVTLDEALWLALVEEARELRVDPMRLVEHSMLLYLADVDSGRLAATVSDAALGGN